MENKTKEDKPVAETKKVNIELEVDTNVVDSSKNSCLLYTSPSPRDCRLSRMPSSA